MAGMTEFAPAHWTGARSRRPPPLQQGALDGLCGLYAVINAMRLLVSEKEAADASLWHDVFALLVLKTDMRVGLASAMLSGLDTKALRHIVNDSLGDLADEFDLRFKVRRPFKDGAGFGEEALREALGWYVQERGCAIVLTVTRPTRHWTVLLELEHDRLRLCDSNERSTLGIGPDREVGDAGLLELVDPRSILIVELRSQSSGRGLCA